MIRTIFSYFVTYKVILMYGAAILSVGSLAYVYVIAPRMEIKDLKVKQQRLERQVEVKDTTILIKDFNATRDDANRDVYEIELTRPDTCQDTDILGLENGGYTIGL